MGARKALLCVVVAAMAMGACAEQATDPRFQSADTGPSRDGAVPGDGGGQDAGPTCIPHTTGKRICTASGLAEEDGCGGTMAVSTCADGSCAGGVCCPADAAPAPAAVYYADWTFPEERLSAVSFHACVGEPPVDVPYTFTMYNASADNTAFTLGLRSIDGVANVILNRTGTSLADVQTVAPSMAIMGASSVTLARAFAWGDGECFTVTMTRNAADGVNDWFDVTLQRDTGGGSPVALGSVRFPRTDAGTAVTVNSGSGSALYYSQGFALRSDLPRWDFSLQAKGNGSVATAVNVTYVQGFGNVDVDAATHSVRVQTGGTTAPCTPAGMHSL